jgi:hypothetical protein
MRVVIFLICYHFFPQFLFSQIDSATTAIIESILRKEHSEGKLYYTDKLDSNIILEIKHKIKARKYMLNNTLGEFETIVISKKEKKYIDSILNKTYAYIWSDSLFANSKRIPKDSMWTHIERKNKEFYAQKSFDTSKNEIIKSIGRQVQNANTFQFSPIIYLREKSIFLFYFIRLCGSLCGVYELYFYRLENGKYKKWLLLSGGAF